MPAPFANNSIYFFIWRLADIKCCYRWAISLRCYCPPSSWCFGRNALWALN